MDEQTLRERLKAAVFGLSIACPYHQGNPDSCQLCQISPVRESRHERDAICLSWLQVEMPERIGASYDGSYNTSPECWEIFTEILGKEFGDAVLFGQVHQLTVDTYAAQHAGGGHRDKSVIIHLGGLHLVLDRGLRPTMGHVCMESMVAKPSADSGLRCRASLSEGAEGPQDCIGLSNRSTQSAAPRPPSSTPSQFPPASGTVTGASVTLQAGDPSATRGFQEQFPAPALRQKIGWQQSHAIQLRLEIRP